VTFLGVVWQLLFAAAARSLTKEQLEAVKLVITEDAKEESAKGFWLGFVVSIPVSIITGILSSWLWKHVVSPAATKWFASRSKMAVGLADADD
jgi:hypothetical protein